MALFQWHEMKIHGGQPVSPFFASPESAGKWRREHPPLIDNNGPTLWKFELGQRVRLEPTELAEAFTEAFHEPQLDLDPVEFP